MTAPHVPAAFINAIAEEGTKAEAIEWLQKQWNENCALRAELRAMRGVGKVQFRCHHDDMHELADELYSAFVSVEMPTPGQREALDNWAAASNARWKHP